MLTVNQIIRIIGGVASLVILIAIILTATFYRNFTKMPAPTNKLGDPLFDPDSKKPLESYMILQLAEKATVIIFESVVCYYIAIFMAIQPFLLCKTEDYVGWGYGLSIGLGIGPIVIAGMGGIGFAFGKRDFKKKMLIKADREKAIFVVDKLEYYIKDGKEHARAKNVFQGVNKKNPELRRTANIDSAVWDGILCGEEADPIFAKDWFLWKNGKVIDIKEYLRGGGTTTIEMLEATKRTDQQKIQTTSEIIAEQENELLDFQKNLTSIKASFSKKVWHFGYKIGAYLFSNATELLKMKVPDESENDTATQELDPTQPGDKSNEQK